MTYNRFEPHDFENTTEWFRGLSRQWQFREPVDLDCRIEPDLVEAASGHTFVITCRVGPDLWLPTGAHITLEVRESWDVHLGNCFRRGVRTTGNRDQIKPGYGAYADVEASKPDAKLEWAVSYGRHLDLLDIVITENELEPGDELRIILGPPDGNLVQVQKHAQVAILPVAVDLLGDGTYRRAKRFPHVKVIGAAPDRLRIFAPGVVQPGASFPIRVLPVDIYSLNRATRYAGTAEGFPDSDLELASPAVELDTEAEPNGASVTAQILKPGVHYVTFFDRKAGISGRSNPIGAGFLPHRGIYFGEMHSQMWESMGTGTTEEFFEWGRDVAGLDFCAPANHYNARYEVTDDLWQRLVDTCNAYNKPGRFVTLVSYEWGGSKHGHNNIYFRGDSGEFSYYYRRRTTPEDMWRSFEGRDVLTVPHHPKALGYTDWSYRNDKHQRLVEICSKWGLSETAGPYSVQHALAMGHRLGFIGGTDSHYGLANQGSYHVNDGNGLACVMAASLERDAIWQALYDRRCYATTGDRILLDLAMNGAPLGTDVTADLPSYGARRFRIKVAGTYRIDRVEIIRNNQTVFQEEPKSETWEGQWVDQDPLPPLAFEPTFDHDRPFVFYYLKITQGNRQMAWSSPIWITQKAGS